MRPALHLALAALLAASGCRTQERPPADPRPASTAGAPPPTPPGVTAATSARAPRPPARATTERASPGRADTAPDVRAAVAVLRGYYAALAARDYPRAYAAWGPDGPPGHPSLAAFRAGFARTASVELTLGAPGRVEGAAGSRYLRVPVTVTATQRDGQVRRYAGSYTLRRSVMPGATPAARRWHLYRAALERTGVTRAPGRPRRGPKR